MKDVEYQTKCLVASIKASNTYNQYQRLLKKIMQEPELYDKMNEFRRRSFALQIKEDSTSLEEINNLRNEFEEVLSNSSVEEFLVAEQRLCNMTRNINTSITEAIDMNLDFL